MADERRRRQRTVDGHCGESRLWDKPEEVYLLINGLMSIIASNFAIEKIHVLHLTYIIKNSEQRFTVAI